MHRNSAAHLLKEIDEKIAELQSARRAVLLCCPTAVLGNTTHGSNGRMRIGKDVAEEILRTAKAPLSMKEVIARNDGSCSSAALKAALLSLAREGHAKTTGGQRNRKYSWKGNRKGARR